MEFRLLGPLEAMDAGRRIPLRLRRQERLLLGILLLNAGRTVSIDRLTDLLWDGEPTANARHAVHTYIGRLRKLLASYEVEIATQADGYEFKLADHFVDALEFLQSARDAAATTDLAERARHAGAALGLWRGSVLEDLTSPSLRLRVGAALEEARLTTAETWAHIQLAMGHHDRVIFEVAGLAEEYPARERLVAAVMTALYRAARQADALHLYDRSRKALAEELDIEPGLELETVYQRILTKDVRLERPAAPIYAVLVGEFWLPWSVGGHPVLEFCNTYAGWGGPRSPGAEWLRGYPTLAVWAGHQDLLDDATITDLLSDAQRDPLTAAGVMDEARELRALLYTCLTDPGKPDAFASVARYVEEAAQNATFGCGSNGVARWSINRNTCLRAPILAVAQSAGRLLADPRRLTVCACSSPQCGWLFIDETGRRRFCSVATCGDPS
ncbi:BTAD domain-containing putative transcriptional regulator [Kribbella sp. NPDC049227]|uniref:BTAD domain-containing putative transcriptional regulator n=1 Tax=Kribbella sp. NPDC049227 TaxID=3364113 RepID=UPI00371B45BB